MNHEEPTNKLALKVWWAFAWRTLYYYVLIGIALIVFFSVIVAVSDTNIEDFYGVIEKGCNLFGLVMGIYIIKRLMTKGFGQFRLVVVRK